MAIPSQQIGWSQKSKLLWNVAKQLEKLTQVAGNVQVTPGPGPITTTTTSTTSAPQPVSAYTGTIEFPTTGNTYFQFQISTKSPIAGNLNVDINWGDNTVENYVVTDGNIGTFSHTFTSVMATNTVTVTVNNPNYINAVIIGSANNPGSVEATNIDFEQFNGMIGLIIGNNLLHTLSINNIYSLQVLQAPNSDLESVAIVDVPILTDVILNNNNLSVLDLTSATNATYVDLSNNQLVAIDISDSPNITYLNLKNNSLAQVGVDNILLALVGANQTGGTVDLSGGANDAPSNTGLSAKNTLEARGWSVIINESSGVQSTLMYFTRPGYESYQSLCYYNVSSSKYVAYRTAIGGHPAPRTVYYSGTLGVNTVLWTNPEMTQFDINLFDGGAEVGAIFTDVAINVNDVNSSLQVYTLSYYGPTPNTVYSNPGTVASVSWNYDYFKQNGSIAPCDIDWQERGYVFYNTSTIGIGTLFANNYTTQWQNIGWQYVTNYSNPTSVYQLLGLSVTAITPCTTAPVFEGATWGYTQQEAIDGLNTFNIKPAGTNPFEPPQDFTFTGCDGIKIADGTPMYQVINGTFWVVYDGLIKQFYVDYTQGSYDRYNAPAVAPVTPPVTPYEIILTPGMSCSSSFNPGNTVTLYSNFPTIQKYATAYTDAARTTTPSWDWYAPQTGLAGYMYYNKWFFTQNC